LRQNNRTSSRAAFLDTQISTMKLSIASLTLTTLALADLAAAWECYSGYHYCGSNLVHLSTAAKYHLPGCIPLTPRQRQKLSEACGSCLPDRRQGLHGRAGERLPFRV
jgi:hypothetical protein